MHVDLFPHSSYQATQQLTFFFCLKLKFSRAKIFLETFVWIIKIWLVEVKLGWLTFCTL